MKDATNNQVGTDTAAGLSRDDCRKLANAVGMIIHGVPIIADKAPAVSRALAAVASALMEVEGRLRKASFAMTQDAPRESGWGVDESGNGLSPAEYSAYIEGLTRGRQLFADTARRRPDLKDECDKWQRELTTIETHLRRARAIKETATDDETE